MKNYFSKQWSLSIIIILISISTESQTQETTFLDAWPLRPVFRQIRLTLLDIFGRTSSTPQYLNSARKINKLQDVIPNSSSFPCNVRNMRSQIRPRSVHELRPGDIDVIGAIGDSLTAGNGLAATHLLQLHTENRGLSWSIGGQGTWREFLTLPNILKEFNPNLVGYSTGDGLSVEKQAQFNIGYAGAMSRDMPHMIKELARRMKNDKRVDYENDWKMITVMIGPNDFCLEICYHNNPVDELEKHRRHMISVFRYIRDNIPRAIVNLVLAPNLEIIVKFSHPGNCYLYRRVLCPCLFGLVNEPKVPRFVKLMSAWQDIEEEVANLPEFQGLDSFAVVVQPFVKYLQFPKTKNNETDHSFLAPDCFHFSQKADAKAANALWNNLLEPVGEKSTNWSELFSPLLCPTEEHPYIYTHKNSNQT